MTVSTKVMTANELLRLPDDDKHYERVEGTLNEKAPAGTEKGRIAMKAGVILYQYAHERGLGEVLAAETGFVLSSEPDTVRAPDVAFVTADRLPSGGLAAGYLHLAPDPVVEVVPPSGTASDLQSKVYAWIDAGCRLVWVVYPGTRSVTVFRSRHDVRALGEEDHLDGSPVFDELNIEVRKLFG